MSLCFSFVHISLPSLSLVAWTPWSPEPLPQREDPAINKNDGVLWEEVSGRHGTPGPVSWHCPLCLQVSHNFWWLQCHVKGFSRSHLAEPNETISQMFSYSHRHSRGARAYIVCGRTLVVFQGWSVLVIFLNHINEWYQPIKLALELLRSRTSKIIKRMSENLHHSRYRLFNQWADC